MTLECMRFGRLPVTPLRGGASKQEKMAGMHWIMSVGPRSLDLEMMCHLKDISIGYRHMGIWIS
jgi:hypothetical protein